MSSQMKRYIGQGLEDPGCRSFYPCRVEGHHRPGVDVFTNLEASRTLYYWDFREASSSRNDQL